MLTFVLLAVTQVPAPPPVEMRLSALEAKVAALESKGAPTTATTCPCGPNCPCFKPPTTPVQTHPFLYNVGDSVSQPTGPAASQFIAAGGWSGQPVQAPVQYAQPMYQPMFMGGGGCANGQCGGSSGGRGLFGRRR